MSKQTRSLHGTDILDEEVVTALGNGIASETIGREREERLRARVLERIDNTPPNMSLFETIRAAEGDWIEVSPLVEKKILQVDAERGVESYLLRMSAGATVVSHHHDSDELCFVIEGDVTFGEVSLKTGDYHCARQGSEHAEASTVSGALLFLQSGIEQQAR